MLLNLGSCITVKGVENWVLVKLDIISENGFCSVSEIIPNVWKKKIVGNEILTSYNCSESEFRSAEFHFITTWTKYHRFLHGIQNIDKVSFFQPIFCVSIHVLKRWRSLLKYCKSQNEFGNRFRFFFIIFQFLAI